MERYYILVGHQPVVCRDLVTWARWMKTADRHVRLTEQDEVSVSTVFLGLDHSWNSTPELFETMVFINGNGDDMERYATWDEANAGHDRWVAKVFKPTEIRNEV